MGLGINTNILSLNAQRNLNSSQSSLATSLERLSTGLRINSARDDAAGLAIAERFTTQIRGLDQAVRNASDGISLSQTAESALGELTNNLQRVRELAIQSANSTNSSGDRAALDLEVQQRIAEIDRIARQTAFNGQNVLDGTFGTAAFQVGANVGETISLTLNTGVAAGQIGQIAEQEGTAVSANALSDGGLNIQVGTAAASSVSGSVEGSGAGQSASSAYSKAAAISAASVPGLTVTASNTQVEANAFSDVTLANGDGSYDLEVNGTTVLSTTEDGVISAENVVAAVNLNTGVTGVSATVDDVTGIISFATTDGRDITVTETLSGASTAGTGVDGSVATGNALRGTISLSAADTIQLSGSQEAEVGFSDSQSITVDDVTLSSINVLDVEESNNTIKRIDSALESVSSLRSNFGAIQNRFESTIANLQAVSENLSASRSRIQDADFAAETAALTRAQILQQAGVSILAQANQQPQVVLSLLG